MDDSMCEMYINTFIFGSHKEEILTLLFHCNCAMINDINLTL